MIDLQFYQTVVTQINHAIGAEGVVSTECKEIVSQYGDMIWDLLVAGVRLILIRFLPHSHTHIDAHKDSQALLSSAYVKVQYKNPTLCTLCR